MQVIPQSHFKLARAKKSLEKAYASGDWDALREWDSEMAACLSLVFEDEQRDTKALIAELESVLAMYGEILKDLPEETRQRTLRPVK